MEDLWKKESHRDSTILVDLLSDFRKFGYIAKWDKEFRTNKWNHCFQSKIIKPVKSNKVSDEFRSEGNVYFYAEKWTDAMRSYNHSLRFAEVGTDNVSFAYANRAACFMRMKKFGECLIDIDLAIKANYPQHLMSKLMNRKAECQKFFGYSGPVKSIQWTPKLSFKPNEKFPCMADVLEIKRNEEFGRHIAATKNIEVGQTILVERPFVSCVSLFDGTHCHECLGINKNFLACSKCTDVMFCCTECMYQNETLHHCCGFNIHRMPDDVKFIAASLFIALTTIPNIDELMTFVDDVLSKRATGIPTAANDPRTKYDTFLSQQQAKASKYDMETIYMVYSGLLNIPHIKSFFNSETTRRFLMHLIMEHVLIISNNSFKGSMGNVLTTYATTCVSSFFNHNCEPNVFNCSTANYEVYITVAQVRKGQQLFISYLSDEHTTRERQTVLLNRWHFICNCDKCSPYKPSDPESQSVKHIGISNPMDFEAKFLEFVSKNGRHPRSAEICAILKQ